jgi:hypothetical protein
MHICMYEFMQVCVYICIARDHSPPGVSFFASAAMCPAGLQLSLLHFTHVVAQKHNSPSFKAYLLGEGATLGCCG